MCTCFVCFLLFHLFVVFGVQFKSTNRLKYVYQYLLSHFNLNRKRAQKKTPTMILTDHTIRTIGIFNITKFLIKFRDKNDRIETKIRRKIGFGCVSFVSTCVENHMIRKFKRIFARGTTAFESLYKPS